MRRELILMRKLRHREVKLYRYLAAEWQFEPQTSTMTGEIGKV